MCTERDDRVLRDPPGFDVRLNRTCGTHLHRTSSRYYLLSSHLPDSRREEVYVQKRRPSTRMQFRDSEFVLMSLLKE